MSLNYYVKSGRTLIKQPDLDTATKLARNESRRRPRRTIEVLFREAAYQGVKGREE